MADLTPAPALTPVWQWDAATPLLGGASTDPMNRQAQALLNRIEYARNQLQTLFNATAEAKVARIEAGGEAALTSTASFYSGHIVTGHAWYGFIENGTANYAGGAPVYGHASFNDNIKFTGVVDSDHHHSFQSYPHYSNFGTISVLSSYWSQIEVNNGLVLEASGLKFNNPNGTGGTINNVYGVKIESLTRGSNNNIGVYVAGASGAVANYAFYSAGNDLKSHFGGLLMLGRGTNEYGSIGYDPVLQNIQVVPKDGFGFKIGSGTAGSKKLILGDPTTDSYDSVIESAGDGHTKFTPRAGFDQQFKSSVQITGTLAFTSKVVSVPTTGASLAMGASELHRIVDPAGTLAALTVTLPASPQDGQQAKVTFTQVVTALTLSSSGTIRNTYTSAAAGQVIAFVYHSATTTWFRTS